MSSEAVSGHFILSPFEQMRFGQEIIQSEAKALTEFARSLPTTFVDAVRLILGCSGSVIVTGMGKAGLIGQKIAATLASTGTRSHFVHPAEAVHGDLGRIDRRDCVIVLSQSGETAEIVNLLPMLAQFEVPLIAVTASDASTLGRVAEVVLPLGKLVEACPLGLAPSTSTTTMLALGDALALVVSRQKGFRRQDFARFHPGGSLGQQLSKVEDRMRPREQCRLAPLNQSVRDVFVQVSRPGRRTGAIMIVDTEGRLAGLFTDSDLARLLELHQEEMLDRPIAEVMTPNPKTAEQGSWLSDAMDRMRQHKLSELPVVDEEKHPLGLLDITDLLDLDSTRPTPT